MDSTTILRHMNGSMGRSMMIRPGTAIALAVASFAASACGRGAPAALIARSDTLIVNSAREAKLVVGVADARGRQIEGARVRWAYAGGDSVRITADGAVTCDRNADVHVTAMAGTMSREFLVRCRPIRTFALPPGVSLEVGGEAKPYELRPIGLDGEVVSLLSGVVRVRDTSIAVMEGQQVAPRGRGYTWLDVHIGDTITHVGVHVTERVNSMAHLELDQIFVDSIQLVPGEMITWRPPAGQLLRIKLVADSAAHRDIKFAVFEANCARIKPEPHDYSCRTRVGSVIAARNDGRREQRGWIHIHRRDNLQTKRREETAKGNSEKKRRKETAGRNSDYRGELDSLTGDRRQGTGALSDEHRAMNSNRNNTQSR